MTKFEMMEVIEEKFEALCEEMEANWWEVFDTEWFDEIFEARLTEEELNSEAYSEWYHETVMEL